LHHRGTLAGVEAYILLAVAQHDGALAGLADRRQRQGQHLSGTLGHQDLPFERLDRSREPETRCQRGVAEPRGKHDFRRADFAAAGADTEVAGGGAGLGHGAVREITPPFSTKPLCKAWSRLSGFACPS